MKIELTVEEARTVTDVLLNLAETRRGLARDYMRWPVGLGLAEQESERAEQAETLALKIRHQVNKRWPEPPPIQPCEMGS